MSYVFNMVGGGSGGGGGPSSSDALLTVTVPTGSTVTATKGGVTLTPTMWVQAADNTLDCALFVIQSSLFDSQNAWTVTASKSPYSDTQSVTVDSNKQYDLTVNLPVPLYYEGTYYNDLSGGFEAIGRRYDSTSAQGKAPTITDYSNYFRYSLYSGGGAYKTVNKIDLTNFGVLRISAKGYVADANLRVGADTGATYWNNSFAAFVSVNGNSAPNRTTFNIDISSLSGGYYITIASSWIGNTVYGDFYEFSLIR